jgi:hypothetical protein
LLFILFKPGLAFKGATLFPSLLLIEDASKGLQQPVFYAEHRRLGGYINMGVIRRRTAQAYNQSRGVFMGKAHKYPPIFFKKWVAL